MRLGGFLSFLFHLAILLLLVLGLPDLFKQEEIAAPVAVQLATLADISGQPVPKPPTPKPVVKQDTLPPPAPTPPPPPTPPAPQPVEQPTPTPPPPTPEPTPPPPEPAPPAPQPAEQIPPEPIPIPDQQQTPPPPQEAKLEAPPPPLLRPPVPPDKPKKPAQQQTQDFNSLLKNVEQMKTTTPDTQQQPQPDAPPQQPDTSASNLSAPQMTSSEKDAIASQVGNSWYLDPGKKGFEDFVVEIRATLAQDGTVLTAVIVDQSRMATDANYRAAAEAARRAVLKASPLKVPPEKYDTWKTMLLRFTPQGVMGL